MTAHEQATKAAILFKTLAGQDKLQDMVIDFVSTDALVEIASGRVGDDNGTGLVDAAIDQLCKNVGPAMARQLCGVD